MDKKVRQQRTSGLRQPQVKCGAVQSGPCGFSFCSAETDPKELGHFDAKQDATILNKSMWDFEPSIIDYIYIYIYIHTSTFINHLKHYQASIFLPCHGMAETAKERGDAAVRQKDFQDDGFSGKKQQVLLPNNGDTW